MKRFIRLTPVAMLLALASCSQDELLPQGDGNVNITVNLPASSYGTRSFSDGYTATDLQYAVYDAASKNMITEGSATFDADKRSTTVSISLATGKSYQIAFFAHRKSQGVYKFNAGSKTIDVNYSAMTDYNSEDYDCFYKLEDVEDVEKGVNKEVTLVRPVAQVNWGTGDLGYPAVLDADAYGAGAGRLVSSVKAKGYTQFDMMAGDVVEGTETEVTFGDKARPAETELFPVESGKYKYVSMQYLLIPKGGTLIDVTLEARNSAGAAALATVEVPNAPVQANYRTNIYGDLLTNPTVFTVVKDERWDGEFDQPISVKEPKQNAKGEYLITSPEELAYLAEYPAKWKGKTLKLQNDIDLKGMSWKPIGTALDTDVDDENISTFKGTFDGQGHTIRNFVCVAKGDIAVAGLFGSVRGSIKRLHIDNAYIESDHYAGGLVAYLNCFTGAQYNDVDYPAEGFEISGCSVKNSTIVTHPNKQDNGKYDNGDKAGGLIGYCRAKVLIKGCSSRNNTIVAYRDLGGLIGHAYVGSAGNTVLDGSDAIGNTLIQDFRNGYKSNADVLNTCNEVIGVNLAYPVTNGTSQAHHSNTIIRRGLVPTNTDELGAAFRGVEDGAVIEIPEGEFGVIDNVGNFVRNKKFSIRGAGKDKTNIAVSNYPFHGCDITVDGMTVNVQGSGYAGFSNYAKGAFRNVRFVGAPWSWGGDGVTYDYCDFDTNGKDNYPIVLIYAGKADFNNCTFKALKGRGIGMWTDSDDLRIKTPREVSVNNCTFIVTGDAKDKAVFDIHTESADESYRGTIRLNNVKYDASKFGGGLWREYINSGDEPKTSYFTIIVDGKTEQTSSRL